MTYLNREKIFERERETLSERDFIIHELHLISFMQAYFNFIYRYCLHAVSAVYVVWSVFGVCSHLLLWQQFWKIESKFPVAIKKTKTKTKVDPDFFSPCCSYVVSYCEFFKCSFSHGVSILVKCKWYFLLWAVTHENTAFSILLSWPKGKGGAPFFFFFL